MKKLWKKPTWYLFLLLLISVIAAIAQVLFLGILPTLYLVIGIVVLLLIVLLLYFMLLSKRINKVNRVLGSILTVIICIVLIIGNMYLFKTNSLFDAITHDGEQKHEISVIVKADSGIDSIKDLHATIGTSTSMSDEVISDFEKDVKTKEDVTVHTEDDGALLEMVEGTL